MKVSKRGLFTSTGALALTVGLLLTGPQSARAEKKNIGTNAAVTVTPITACGQTTSASGVIYKVTANLNQSSASANCITLSGSNSTLDLNGFTISFTGAAGTSTKAGVANSGGGNVIEGANSTIMGFAEGVLDTGDNTVGDSVNMFGNKIGLEMNGTSGEATQIWTNFSADTNTMQGVYINHCTDECTISDFDASGNGADGVLVTNSDGPRINIFTADSNGGAGVHAGCTSGCGDNSRVKIFDSPIGFPSGPAITGNAGDGVFLDATETGNMDQVFFNNAGADGGIDMHDASTTCSNNLWVHNDWGTSKAGATSSPACIPNVPI